MQRSLSRCAPTAVIAIGIHDLRLVDEAFGHAASDALLVAVAERLAAEVPATDVACRSTGGEDAG